MTFTTETIKALSGKLDPAHIKPPSKFGPKGDYIEGWHAIAEANRIFGYDGWSYDILEVKCVSERDRGIGKDQKAGFGVTYTARVCVIVQGVQRVDVGAGHGYDVDCGLAHESAIKEAVTDGLKRALRTFGNPFGLALYDKTREGVGIDPPELSAPAKVMLATIDGLTSRSDVSEWVFANREAAERLKDGAAVLAHARAHFKALPEELQEAAE
jgi:DNA repair and recombination protein RAD52